MKTKLFLTLTLLTSALFAQQKDTITFENLNLANETYWDGVGGAKDTTVDFSLLQFHNNDDYGYWLGGFAYSTVTDTTNKSSYYNAISAKGANNSKTYAIGQDEAIITHSNIASVRDVPTGLYITNSTYAYNSMLKGDNFSKKFGGVSGNDTDWFKLTIEGKFINSNTTKTVEFYLADFRFSDNTKDYIISDWTFVDLSSMGEVDTLLFTLSSTDNGQYGMNTPKFYCLDNLTIEHKVGIKEVTLIDFAMFPNPANNSFYVDLGESDFSVLQVYDLSGRLVLHQNLTSSKINVDISSFTAGVYSVQLSGKDGVTLKKLIKN